ncbi:phytoene/squalene synthase family protein [Planctomicrobium piriforme]|uniref:Phytoene synthase n=1 Tax=Planctomicrobium piriforme TaxID=1576369 RepID=A0A1I3I851_9PLAN|nr:phytoene/squalene synthase family protein [Planctomicrobium piriforme]SFI44037.1 phytoene synthase [Planctomicrobium piriforme]
MRSDLEKSYASCEQIARQSGSSFFLAFRTLPRGMYREMCVLYAFMRRTDDLGDDARVPPEMRADLLHNWQSELTAALNGEYVPSRILPALADVALRREIPSEYLQEAVRGVQSDLQPHTVETFADLEHYCYQVAGVVGLCCLRIWGYRGDEPREPALACGTAFQLTNILRDLREDAQNGRVYLPREDLERFGYSKEDLLAGRYNTPFRELMQFQVERAWTYYDAALPLRHHLSPEGRRIFVNLFDLYRSLLERIERADYDVLSHRIRLSYWKKAEIVLRCLLRLDGSRQEFPLPRRPLSSCADTC